MALRYRNVTITLVLVLSLLTACSDSNQQDKVTASTAIELDDSNINTFTVKTAKKYQTLASKLFKAFEQAQKANDEHSFIDYRNNVWTPKYIEYKQYLQKTQQSNKAYLADKTTTNRLFDAYENLIYIGLDLKNGLLNKDDEQIANAYKAYKKDQKNIKAILVKSNK